MTLTKKEIVIQLINEAFESVLTNKDADFAWELFWKFWVFSKISNYNFNLIQTALGEERKDFNKIELLDEKDPDIVDVIKERKKALNKQHGIKRITLAAYREQIVTFFKEKRNIDFNSLDETAANTLLQHEDIMSNETPIYDFLNMTHMQFKYLYQRGGVFK